jgi:hypothetical protein
MNVPNPVQLAGPPQLQELQNKVNQLIEYAKSLKLQSSPTVRAWHTAVGQYAEANPPAPVEAEQEPGDARWS